MSTVPEQLQQAREEQGLSIHELAEATKIKTDHIRALEQGNYRVFAAPIYIRGFVRTCATVLRLDTHRLLEALDEELRQDVHFRDAPGIGPRRRGLIDSISYFLSKRNWKVIAPIIGGLLLVLGALFGYGEWQRWRSRDPLAHLGPGIFQSRQTNTGELLPLPRPSKP
jgi:cytoskeleton protein RodZ